MNTMEKIPMAMLATTEATDPRMLDTPEKLVTSLSLPNVKLTMSKSRPRSGKILMIHALIRSIMSLSKVTALFMASASRMMPETIGMTWVTIRTMMRMIDTRVNTERSQSGAECPFIVICLSARNTGCPMREMTKAAMMYIKTLRKYQHKKAMMANAPILMICFASLSMFLSCSMLRVQ